jgi:hypothetical protein
MQRTSRVDREVQNVDEDTAGRCVVLIDTPRFDDTSLSDVDVLNMIAAFFENSYVKLNHNPS